MAPPRPLTAPRVRVRPRRVQVGGRPFVWHAEIGHVQGTGDCHRCIRVRASAADGTGRPLEADLLSLAWPAPWGGCATDGSHPTPADVRALIAYALAHGWTPGEPGATFVLTERAHAAAFALPGFALTDRPRTPESLDPTDIVLRAHEQHPARG